jgi:hypothetical protein
MLLLTVIVRPIDYPANKFVITSAAARILDLGSWNNHLFSPVKTAFRANTVQLNPVSAGTALNQGRGGQLHIDGLSPAGSCLRRFRSGYSHSLTSLRMIGKKFPNIVQFNKNRHLCQARNLVICINPA